MNDRPGEDLIVGYIRGYTKPVQWIGWWLDAAGTPAGESLGTVLFEPDGETSRDLTGPVVRDEVIRVILESEPLRQAVGAEAERFLETVAERLAKGQA